MNKLQLLFGGAVVAVVIGAVVYNRTRPSQSPQTDQQDQAHITSDADQAGGSETISSSFLELIRLGKSYHCTFTFADENNNTTKGKVYVTDQGDRLKGDFTLTPADSDPIDSHVIRDGEYNYVWTSLQEQGFKSKIMPETQDELFPSTNEREDDQQPFDESQKVDFDCDPWTVDETIFTPPGDIEFIDFSAQLEETFGKIDEANQDVQDKLKDACDTCQQAPAGTAREQCLQALGC